MSKTKTMILQDGVFKEIPERRIKGAKPLSKEDFNKMGGPIAINKLKFDKPTRLKKKKQVRKPPAKKPVAKKKVIVPKIPVPVRNHVNIPVLIGHQGRRFVIGAKGKRCYLDPVKRKN